MPNYLDIHGNNGLIVHEIGTLNTDYYGLDTGRVVWKIRQDYYNNIPDMRSQHPIWSWLTMEKRTVAIEPGFALITGEYAGIQGSRKPSVFECSAGTSDEPIETHPDFVDNIAGKPSSPLNGAIFLDPKTNQPTTDDAKGVFDKFTAVVGGVRNEFAGVQAYLSPQVVLREVWISTIAVVANNVGKISSPPFTPGVPGNWLQTGVSFQQRGLVFQNVIEWRSSGRYNWNTTLY